MEDKLKRVAIKLSEYFKNKNFETVDDTYHNFGELYKKHNDYFTQFKASEIIKLVFYIFSYKTTGNFKLAEKYLNSIAFATLFYTTSNKHNEGCSTCLGDGSFGCQYCDGDGNITCEECDGDGSVTCDTCDGTGEIEEGLPCSECQGGGTIVCDTCGGGGQETCNQCDGDGYETCRECDGSGEIETDEKEYELYTICTWNSEIKNACELNVGTREPAMSEFNFDKLKDDYITLHLTDEHSEFREFVEDYAVYCCAYSDEPSLYIGTSPFYMDMWNNDLEKYTL